jgi:hypothetical protein
MAPLIPSEGSKKDPFPPPIIKRQENKAKKTIKAQSKIGFIETKVVKQSQSP